jgi:LuxR family transcriptional regulator, maltose regulon positive regulatory protein
MAQIPSVADGLLQGTRTGGAAGLAVGSSAWFAWLADDAARSFSFRSPSGAYTARKERRQRGGVYWVAYRTAAGRQHKVYLGKAEDLTPERLDKVADALARRVTGGAGPPGEAPPPPARVPGPMGQGAAGLPLLATKVFVPRPRPDLVPRPRLLARLDAGLDAGPVLAAVGAGRRGQDQPAGRLARPAGPPGRLAHPRRTRPGGRPGPPLPRRRSSGDGPRLRPRGAGVA